MTPGRKARIGLVILLVMAPLIFTHILDPMIPTTSPGDLIAGAVGLAIITTGFGFIAYALKDYLRLAWWRIRQARR
jgi:hypothetical protein